MFHPFDTETNIVKFIKIYLFNSIRFIYYYILLQINEICLNTNPDPTRLSLVFNSLIFYSRNENREIIKQEDKTEFKMGIVNEPVIYQAQKRSGVQTSTFTWDRWNHYLIDWVGILVNLAIKDLYILTHALPSHGFCKSHENWCHEKVFLSSNDRKVRIGFFTLILVPFPTKTDGRFENHSARDRKWRSVILLLENNERFDETQLSPQSFLYLSPV